MKKTIDTDKLLTALRRMLYAITADKLQCPECGDSRKFDALTRLIDRIKKDKI